MNSRVRIKTVFLFVLVLALGWAQTPTGGVEGIVTDPSGAVVPNAKVIITEASSGRIFPALATDATGRFALRNLLPGSYHVRVEASNFSAKEVRNVVVSSGSIVNANVALEVGRTTEIVQVSAEAVIVDTSRQTVDTVISGKEVRDIPLFSRNFLDLAALAPGVMVREGGVIDPTKEVAYLVVGVNGRSGTGTRVQVDGIDVTDETVGTTVANISQDALEEFQLTRSSLDPSTSLTSSGAININTRYGGNDFHGNGFFDYYNQDMGARLDYNPEAVPFLRKRYGVAVGGPLVKDKVFWFAQQERTYRTGQEIFTSGDFPQLNKSQDFPVGIRYTSGRLDWNASNAIRLFYRFNHDWNLSTGGSAPSPFQNVNWTNMHVVGFNFNTARTTHAYRFGYVNFNNRIQSEELALKFPTVDGLPYYLGVGTYQAGPNSLAPQQTYQDNFQNGYEGTWAAGKHMLRFGVNVTRILQGGFANFAGPLTVNGTYDAATKAAVAARGANVQDPLEYPFEYFSTGPQAGFFTLKAGHNLPHGGKTNTRLGFFVQDNWKMSRRLNLNLGLRWQYDSGYFSNDHSVPRDKNLELYIKGGSEFPNPPKKMFSPSVGIAFDPTGAGKTSIRAGFYLGYEMNIINNVMFDEYAMLPPGIGPDSYDYTHVAGPDGKPVNADGRHPDGDYSDLEGRRLKDVIGLVGQVHRALNAAYAGFQFDPKKGESAFTQNLGNTFGGQIAGNSFKPPYAVQFNVGVQREISAGTVLTADYVVNHGVGLPFFIPDFERRRDAATLNVAAARTQVNRVLGGLTVDDWIQRNPTRNISAFGLITDTIFQGLYPQMTRARLFQGGFTKYQGLQVAVRGRVRQKWGLRDVSYNVSYALGRAQNANSAGSRVEFITNPLNNRNWNDKATFGPHALDRTHMFSTALYMTAPGGFRLQSYWVFNTAPPRTITVPNLGGAISGAQGFFGTDLNGDGGTGTSPRGDVFPGINAGGMGRQIHSFDELNKIISAFNQNNAGKITPHGQALVTAGLFTEAQLRRLGAVVPTVPLVPTSNPWPFHNLFTTDLRFDRPIRLTKVREGFSVIPFVDFLNLFNHAPVGAYAGLLGRFGSLNYDYSAAPAGQKLSDLYAQTHRITPTRRIQVGVRVEF